MVKRIDAATGGAVSAHAYPGPRACVHLLVQDSIDSSIAIVNLTPAEAVKIGGALLAAAHKARV